RFGWFITYGWTALARSSNPVGNRRRSGPGDMRMCSRLRSTEMATVSPVARLMPSTIIVACAWAGGGGRATAGSATTPTSRGSHIAGRGSGSGRGAWVVHGRGGGGGAAAAAVVRARGHESTGRPAEGPTSHRNHAAAAST